MPYVSRDLLRVSLEALGRDYSPLLLVSLPCMLNKKIPTCETIGDARKDAIPFGSTDEGTWLNEFFRIPGGPAGKPFYMPGTRDWVQEAYPGKSLQRRRKDYDGTVFHHPDDARWALRSHAAEVLRDKVLGQKKQPPVPLVALMCWMWRSRDMSTLASGLDEFTASVGFDRDDLLKQVYSKEIARVFLDAGLAEAPLNPTDISELVGAATPPPQAPDLNVAIAEIEAVLRVEHYEVPSGLIERILVGWLVSDIVVLLGPSGSGKTALARLLGRALEKVFGKDRFVEAFLEVSPGYGIAEFLGYENLAGEFSQGRFAKEALFVGEPTDPRLVVLDEWNLAQIDAYFAPVLSVVESKRPMRLPGRVNMANVHEDEAGEMLRAQPLVTGGQWSLQEDTFFLATCNGWADEPETRLPISGPVKRRCRIIGMPNVLAARYQAKGREGIYEVCDTLLAQERNAVEGRKQSGDVSVWDRHREERLNTITKVSELNPTAYKVLGQIVGRLLDDINTRGTITVGILRDVLLSCVYAPTGRDVDTLGQQIADKVLHQLNGEPKVLEVVVELCKDLPNAGEIEDLARRMGAYSGQRRIRPQI